MKLDDLLKKLYSLKDLRHAITEVKNLSKDAKVMPMKGQAQAPAPAQKPPANPTAAPRKEAQSAIAGAGTHLRHLGIKSTQSGQMTHMVGLPGSNSHYEINMNMHNAAQKKPSFTVSHVDGQGGVKSQHPMVHDSINSAVKALVHHSHHGEWNQ